MAGHLGIQKILSFVAGESIAASGVIPPDEEFFSDHFPGFPVLPGVLGLEMLRQTAEAYVRESGIEDPLRSRIKKITGVKFARYLKPGDVWESMLQLESREGNLWKWNAKLMHQGQVAVSARFLLETAQPAKIGI
jgi:3-hydroxyacyl-[acyl-carrier-protein] dehydratase